MASDTEPENSPTIGSVPSAQFRPAEEDAASATNERPRHSQLSVVTTVPHIPVTVTMPAAMIAATDSHRSPGLHIHGGWSDIGGLGRGRGRRSRAPAHDTEAEETEEGQTFH